MEHNPEFTREYIFNDPLMDSIICRPNCCLFCDNCTDIFYDSRGPYAVVCLNEGNFKMGMLGKCSIFREEATEN